MKPREQRLALAQETLEIIEKGCYTNTLQQNVSIAEAMDYSITNTRLYKPEALPLTFDKTHEGECIIEVTRESTFAAAKRLVQEEAAENICCLNFASARNPGGGFLKGTTGQEETLTRASGLYASLVKQTDYYDNNRATDSNLFTDHIIYSPLVPVFRDDNSRLTDDYFTVSVITAPAVNAKRLEEYEPEKMDMITPVNYSRMQKFLSVAAAHKQTTLVLGAWGCGIFGNETKEMAGWFSYHLLQNEMFANTFKRIVFAVYAQDESDYNYQIFKKEFSKYTNRN
ncbi:TIGR02452 family protein [Filimonas lacunae]|nr:TIGR02452 family protein [Filimonas lacunae]BAV04028.1 hypothetical protein FLA_0006 [Filimonas lacunae]